MEADFVLIWKVLLTVVLGGFTGLFIYLYNVLLSKPKRLRSELQRQGIKGPSPSPLLGNILQMKRMQPQMPRTVNHQQNLAVSHDWPSTLFPYLEQWRSEYGSVFVYSTGNIQHLCTTDLEMLKEISLCTSLDLGKPSYLSKLRGPLLGQGLLSSSGPIWARERKIIAPELSPNKVKVSLLLLYQMTLLTK